MLPAKYSIMARTIAASRAKIVFHFFFTFRCRNEKISYDSVETVSNYSIDMNKMLLFFNKCYFVLFNIY